MLNSRLLLVSNFVTKRKFRASKSTTFHLLDVGSKPFRTMDKKKLKNIFDVAILRHGFAFYNRDYDFSIEMEYEPT